MRVLQSWVFVNCATLTAGLASLLVLPTAPKMTVEFDMRAYFMNVVLAGFVWLLLAIVRFLVVSHERNS